MRGICLHRHLSIAVCQLQTDSRQLIAGVRKKFALNPCARVVMTVLAFPPTNPRICWKAGTARPERVRLISPKLD